MELGGSSFLNFPKIDISGMHAYVLLSLVLQVLFTNFDLNKYEVGNETDEDILYNYNYNDQID